MLELKSKSLRATFSPLGARLVSVFVDGVDIMAGGGTDEQILAGDWTAGAVCGRIAGRISNARFTLDGAEHKLVANMGEHQLHGGPGNFAIRRWDVQHTDKSVRFAIHSADGDQGFPGALDATATYALDGNTLSLDFEAGTTKPTVINLTNHAYWNLSGGARNAFDHEMQIDGARFLPLNDLLLPSGEIRDVAAPAGTSASCARLARTTTIAGCWMATAGHLRHGLTLRDPRFEPPHGSLDHRRRHADVHRLALEREHARPQRPAEAIRRHRHRTAKFPRRPQPPEFSQRRAPPRRNLPPPHGVAVSAYEAGSRSAAEKSTLNCSHQMTTDL